MNAPDTTDAAAFRITVNGEEKRLPEAEASVAALLRHLGIDPEQPGLAVAVDDEVVRRQDWGDTRLTGSQRVELITAQQGG